MRSVKGKVIDLEMLIGLWDLDSGRASNVRTISGVMISGYLYLPCIVGELDRINYRVAAVEIISRPEPCIE